MTESQKVVSSWEAAFNTLDKRSFSVEAVGGYDFSGFLQQYGSPDSIILDYGCGTGAGVRRLRAAGYRNVYGTDPSEFLLKDAAHESDIFCLMNGPRIPFPDATFDIVYCSGVLHHIEWSELGAVLGEIGRVLKPRGKFVFAEPRPSLGRELGHVVLLSPLSRLSKNAAAMADCLRAEWPTYRVWLDREEDEWLPLCRTHGFSLLELRKRAFTLIGVLQHGQ